MIFHHLQRDGWLISGYHVACLKDLHKCETVAATHFGHSFTVHLVVLDSGSIEVCLVWPVKCQSPLHVSKPVANVVLVTGINQSADAIGKHIWNDLVPALHPISSIRKQ